MIALLTAVALAWTPTDAEQKLVTALSARDGAPACDELAALVPEPAMSLERVVDHVAMPPWAPMNAAACLIEHHSSDKAALLESWVVDPDKKGLAKLVFNRMHVIEPTQARALADKARSGPYTRELNAALARSPKPELRDLAR